jgi:hypothetical protein
VIVSDPEVGLVPDQPPEAVQAAAFAVDQVSVVVPPVTTPVAAAVRLTVGAGTTVTATCACVLPAPLQLSVYVPLEETVTCSDPEVALAPVQLPDAVHDEAFVEDHVSITGAFAAT